MKILIVGSGAREHAIAKAFHQSASHPTLFCYASSFNPGIKALTKDYWIGKITCVETILQHIKPWKIDLAIIGPETPLQFGLADALEKQAIPTVGPKKKLAQIETSKTFTRNLLKKHQIPGSLQFRAFSDLTGVMDFLHTLGEEQYVIKADGLMGGKGVKVAGDHLHSHQEAYQFCQSLVEQNLPFIIEEKLIGQEFSMLNFCDGTRLIPMPLIQDHKRAYVGDKGPNTGGMGSFTDANHSLPFLTEKDISFAQTINQAVIAALIKDCGEPYKGILYGSFMATRDGVRLIEYNARFGDPEAMNVLAILDSDFTQICQSLALGRLEPEQVRFKPLATVCKYAVPLGYPDKPKANQPIDVSQITNPNQLYFATLNVIDGQLYTATSRTLAVVGIAPTIAAAELLAEKEISRIQGSLFHREDIGTMPLINQRTQMMKKLRQQEQNICNKFI